MKRKKGQWRSKRIRQRDKADKLWSLAVRLRDNWTCRRCNKKYKEKALGYHPHHIFTRSKFSTRFDLDNGLGLCSTCHDFAGEHPHDFKDWLISQPGWSLEKWNELRYMSNQVKKIDYEITVKVLEAMVREYEWRGYRDGR